MVMHDKSNRETVPTAKIETNAEPDEDKNTTVKQVRNGK